MFKNTNSTFKYFPIFLNNTIKKPKNTVIIGDKRFKIPTITIDNKLNIGFEDNKKLVLNDAENNYIELKKNTTKITIHGLYSKTKLKEDLKLVIVNQADKTANKTILINDFTKDEKIYKAVNLTKSIVVKSEKPFLLKFEGLPEKAKIAVLFEESSEVEKIKTKSSVKKVKK